MSSVLGIDPGVTTGFCLIETGLDKEGAASWQLVDRWQESGSLLDLWTALHRPEYQYAVVEKGFSLAQQSALDNAERLGVVRLVMLQRGITLTELRPAVIRQVVAGRGNAKSGQVRRAVRDWCSIPKHPGKGKGLSDHQADAIAAVLAFLYMGQMGFNLEGDDGE